MASPWRRRSAYVFGVVVALVFLAMGGMKFDPNGFWTASFGRWGYPVWFRYGIGALEVAGGLLLLVPRFTSYAAGLLLVIMVGAFATRLQDGLSGDHVGIAVYAAVLAWVVYEWWGRRLRASGPPKP